MNANTTNTWQAQLQEFTQRNAGRRSILEENDRDLGAQNEETGLELRGVAFDPHDQSVAIMMGELEGTEHLTHRVGNVSGIDILRSDQGRDLVLRISRPGGQTLLRFA